MRRARRPRAAGFTLIEVLVVLLIIVVVIGVAAAKLLPTAGNRAREEALTQRLLDGLRAVPGVAVPGPRWGVPNQVASKARSGGYSISAACRSKRPACDSTRPKER